MRELVLVREESTPSSLVFRLAAPEGETEEQFFLEVTGDIRAILLDDSAGSAEDQDGASTAAPGDPDKPAASSAEGSTDSQNPVSEGQGEGSGSTRVGLHTTPPSPKREPDPALSAPLTMRPREIQEKIRAGASVTELAEAMGVAESRVEVFAYPVLQERARIAEMAKQAHPVRDDGPAKLNLFEVLATALAARGHDLADASWDAFRETSGQWVVTVTWTVGLSENVAEWTLHNHTTSSATAVARNGVAADLTDPDFVQPVRSLTSVHRWDEEDEPVEQHRPTLTTVSGQQEDESATERTRDDIPPVEADSEPAEEDQSSHEANDEDDLLQHPDPENSPSKRRRRAVTPHWEDVLLGVRANTKRPRK